MIEKLETNTGCMNNCPLSEKINEIIEKVNKPIEIELPVNQNNYISDQMIEDFLKLEIPFTRNKALRLERIKKQLKEKGYNIDE